MSLSRISLLSLFVATNAVAAPHDSDRLDLRADGSVTRGAELFSSLSGFYRSDAFRTGGLRCGNAHQEPIVAAFATSDCSMSRTRINTEYDGNETFVIQVVFHVITKSDGTGLVSRQLIESQLDVLNEDYRAMASTPGAGGTNTRVKFVLARFDPDGEPTTGIEIITSDAYFADPGSDGVNPMKLELGWEPDRYLNIYTNDAGGNGLLGYATFPQMEAGQPQDGIVLNYLNVGRNAPNAAPYDLGRTLTHEVGHYLGLFHTFQGGCGSASAPYTTGDLVGDTARELEPTYGCTAVASACGGGAKNPIENYMDYSDDRCMTKFTPEQSNRIRCGIVNYRNTNTEPQADVAVTTNGPDASFLAMVTDLESTSEELVYDWSFGDGASSSEPDPTHRYAKAGSYTVTLEVIDPDSAATRVSKTITIASDDTSNGADGGAGTLSSGCNASGSGTRALLPFVLALALRRRRRGSNQEPRAQRSSVSCTP